MLLPFRSQIFSFAMRLLPRLPPGGSWILRSKRLRESAATRENRLECGERKRLCAAGSFRHAVACHLDVLLAKLDAACGRTSRRKAYGKRCFSCSPIDCENSIVFPRVVEDADPYRVSLKFMVLGSPIDCGNLFGFLDRRGRRSLRVLHEFYCSLTRPLFQKNGARSFF